MTLADHGWIFCSLLLSLCAGCEETDPPSPEPSSEAETKDRGSGATAGPSATDPGTLRCADFLSAEEAEAIGVDEYDPKAEQADPGLGVHCSLSGEVALTIFRGKAYSSMVGGAKHAELEPLEGPTIGQKSYWYESSGLPSVAFLSDNGNYAAGMSAKDKSTLEKIATSLAPYLDKS